MSFSRSRYHEGIGPITIHILGRLAAGMCALQSIPWLTHAPAACSLWKSTQSLALLRHNRTRYRRRWSRGSKGSSEECTEISRNEQVSRPGKPTTRHASLSPLRGAAQVCRRGRERDYNLMLRLF
ncbi:hypothetical protein ANTQUA_LOCUS7525 [Anthophora quadrimaculata]